MRFGLDVAQQRMPWDEVVSRVQFAEDLGFDGAWGFDHFQPMYGEGPGECFEGVTTLAAMQMLILPDRQLFICDTHVNRDPSAVEIAEMTLLAAEEMQRFGVKPSVALLSHSSFGSSDAPSAVKMREALALIVERAFLARSSELSRKRQRRGGRDGNTNSCGPPTVA